MSRTLFSLAGFQVITIGRFWVIAEATWTIQGPTGQLADGVSRNPKPENRNQASACWDTPSLQDRGTGQVAGAGTVLRYFSRQSHGLGIPSASSGTIVIRGRLTANAVTCLDRGLRRTGEIPPYQPLDLIGRLAPNPHKYRGRTNLEISRNVLK